MIVKIIKQKKTFKTEFKIICLTCWLDIIVSIKKWSVTTKPTNLFLGHVI